MINLKLLIAWWKEREKPHPPTSEYDWSRILKDTIAYLEELQALKGGRK